MLFCADIPAKVAINESLELAKRYSTAQSSRFVNGILDRVFQRHVHNQRSNQVEAVSTDAETEYAAAEPQQEER